MSAKQMSIEDLYRSLIKAGHSQFLMEIAVLPATGRVVMEFQNMRGGRKYRIQVINDELYHIPVTAPPNT